MAILDKIKLSGTTYDIVDSTAIHSLDGYWTSGETSNAITAATEALAQAIAEQHYQTSGDVENAISGKADTTAVTQSINAAVSGKADTTAVTEAISEAVSGKADTTAVTEAISAATDDMATQTWVGEQGYQTATDVQNAISGKADIGDIPSVTGYADAVAYDSSTQYMKFYHGGTGGTEVYSFDASPFLIDGMVESVEITSITSGGSTVEVLEITWNSAAGSQVTDIPLSDIFDPSNYYTKAQIDTTVSGITARLAEDEEVTAAGLNALNSALSGKADTSAVTEAISEATSGKVDTSTYNTYTAATNTALNGKQDELTAGDSISIDSDTINTKYIGWGDFEEYNFLTSGPFYVVVGFDCVGYTNGSAIFEFEVDNERKEVRIDFDSSTESWTCDSREDPQICEDLWQYLDISWDSDKNAFYVEPQVEVTANDNGCARFTYDLIGAGTTTDALNEAFYELSEKQPLLISGENIKTINNESILGYGNIDIQGGNQVEVSGTTLVFL